MKIDSMLKIAVSMQSGNKGAYALLLGSGISRSSGIKTGWEVICELIRRIAKLKDEVSNNWIDEDAFQWGKENLMLGEDPAYGELLKALYPKPAERRAVLEPFFEPTDDEKQHDLKTPTKAHRAIAWLVNQGYVRVIITTNFDRLLEQAIREEGIEPSVADGAKSLTGLVPYTHAGCTILKVNGDYKSEDTANTEEELSSYPEEQKAYLRRIFEDFGLIICGWSGEWDVDLRETLKNNPPTRYSNYWLTYKSDKLKDKAKEVFDALGAEKIETEGADDFFESLKANIESLASMYRTTNLSADALTAMVKRYMVDSSKRIHLHDLFEEQVRDYVDNLDMARTTELPRAVSLDDWTSALLEAAQTEHPINKMISALSYYGDEQQHVELLQKTIVKIAEAGHVDLNQSYSRINNSQQITMLWKWFPTWLPACQH
jgi:hypothetical protein